MKNKSKCESSNSCSDMSSNMCSISSKSSSYKICCKKYPKCKCSCVENKCAPIYYPNNYVGPYPCGPKPCEPREPCYPCDPCYPIRPRCQPICPPACAPPYPPPYPVQNCGTPYTTSRSTTSLQHLNATSPNINIYSQEFANITLPSISSLVCCNYNKMFIISNIGNGSITVLSNNVDSFTTGTTSLTIDSGFTVILYAVYIQNSTSYWTVTKSN